MPCFAGHGGPSGRFGFAAPAAGAPRPTRWTPYTSSQRFRYEEQTVWRSTIVTLQSTTTASVG
ncbi:MAG: hypothetical protein ACM3ZE_01850 [Myxococcales bacterium]